MCEISVIIPVYNKNRYIAETVKSVLDQTFGDFELLLIDDGSTDGSGVICDELSALDGRVKVFHTENRGVSAARNHGLRKARGRYISFIDADDHTDPTFLEKLCTSIKKENADMAVCTYYEVKDGKRIEHEIKNSDTGDEVYEVLRHDLLCVLWNKLYIREKIRHFFDERIATSEDSLFCAQYYLDNRPKIACVKEALYGYLRHGEGLTSSVQDHSFLGINLFLNRNLKVSKRIRDERLRQRAVHHIYKVYFYGIYMFIFMNIGSDPGNKENLSVIDKVICNRRYRHIVKHILRYPLCDGKAERTSKTEFLYIVFSLLKMKRAICVLSKVKKAWK